MAASTISLEQEQFCCSVCLEVLRDPATIPCGHSYCLECIEDYWNKPKQKSQYSCPQCRQLFNPKPLLSRNTVLAEVVEKIQRSTVQAETPQATQREAVRCSICTGRASRAVKSCLVCLRSYCVAHLRAHEDHFRGRAHKLIPALDHLPERVCPQHGKLLRLYCPVDQRCVCSQCVRERHRGHNTVPVADERAKQQHSTKAAIEESERIFSKLIHSIEKHSSQVKDLIRLEERAAVRRAEDVLEKVQKEIAALHRAKVEVEKLSGTEDHIHFLEKCKSINFPSTTLKIPNTDELPYVMYKITRQTLGDLKDSLKEKLQQEFDRISNKENSLKENTDLRSLKTTEAEEMDTAPSTGPKSRYDLLQYYNNLTLDANTANPYLCLTDDCRGVSTHAKAQPYPEHPQRFSSWAQVLCRAGMAGRCYWEVEWTGNDGVSIGICYKNMSRSGGGNDSKLGHNSSSWSLDCSPLFCTFRHNQESWTVATACSSRIGVELDFRAGTLSFYNVTDTFLLLHTVHTTFSQPVFPGFWVGLGSRLRLRWMATLN